MSGDLRTLLTIAGMAAVTYAMRAGGLWLMGRVPLSGRGEAALRHVPGAVLVSLVVPGMVGGGLPTLLAGAVTAAVAVRTGNALIAMVAGVLAVVGLRLL
jgi:uncharacterized membrane protein